MKTQTHKCYYGLEYITAVFPMEKTKAGWAIQSKVMKDIDWKVCRHILEKGVPIRGLELRFLRKRAGMSMALFGAALDISPTGIMKWEQDEKKRLDPINEVAVRALCAQLFGVKLAGTFKSLRGVDKAIPLKASAA